MILDRLTAATKIRVEKAKSLKPLSVIASEAKQSVAVQSCCQTSKLPNIQTSLFFETAVSKKGLNFICEVKRASPSKGLIAKDFNYTQIAKDYENAGASAISVLTEPDYFLGKNEYLTEIKKTVKIPVLRKDFIIDEYQIYEAKVIGADAILLIAAILTYEKLSAFMETAAELGLSCLTEIHDEKEAETALKSGARIIGVNNRDLKTFQVDLQNSLRLRKLIPEDKIFVSESGIKTKEDIALLRENSVNAVLIGEELMKSANVKEKLAELQCQK